MIHVHYYWDKLEFKVIKRGISLVISFDETINLEGKTNSKDNIINLPMTLVLFTDSQERKQKSRVVEGRYSPMI